MSSKKTPTNANEKLLSLGERICLGISFLLTIAFYAGAANTHDAQWQATFMIAGFLYMLTTLGLAFDKADFMDEEKTS